MKRNSNISFYFCVLNVVVAVCSQRALDYVDDAGRGNDVEDEPNLKSIVDEPERPLQKPKYDYQEKLRDCWISFNAQKLIDEMDNLDRQYDNIRLIYQKDIKIYDFDAQMLDMLVNTRGAAERAVNNFGGDDSKIPAGMNLGGHFMLKLTGCYLFFHRMKLRNSTRFNVDYLHSNLTDMILTVRLSLNDLHLLGSYERAITANNDPFKLFYKPTFGQIEFLLKDAKYNMEGRYRFLQDRLVVELVSSDLTVGELLMIYQNDAKGNSSRLLTKNVEINSRTPRLKDLKNYPEELLRRLRVHLDKWLKDYFNDYLMYFGLLGSTNDNYQKYDKTKAIILNDYVDEVIEILKKRLRKLRATSFKVPNFTLVTINGIEIKLHDGVLRGLDSMHRRSVGTSKRQKNIRKVDAVLGFSKLKLEYKYEAVLPNGVPPLTGLFILSADDLTASLNLDLLRNPETVDLHIDVIELLKPEALTVEGSVNRAIAKFKHLLENQILSIMSNMLYQNIKLLSSLTKCEPNLPGYLDPGDDKFSDEEDEPPPQPTPEHTPEEEIPPSQQEDSIEQPTIVPDDPDSAEPVNPPVPDEVPPEDAVPQENEKEDEPKEKEDKPNYNSTEFGVDREDSIEIEVPVAPNLPPRKMHILYKKKFKMAEVTKK